MVEHTVRDREVVGSSPTTPTKFSLKHPDAEHRGISCHSDPPIRRGKNPMAFSSRYISGSDEVSKIKQSDFNNRKDC